MMVELVAGLVALVTSLMTTSALKNPNSRLVVLDYPNERSLHVRPVPRTGGLGILAGIMAGLVILTIGESPLPPLGWLFGASLVLAAVSYLDDYYSLPVVWRLGVQVTVAIVVLMDDLVLQTLELPNSSNWLPEVIGIPLTVVFLVWMTNLYNFMDGMDGFAGGMAVFGFGAFACLGIVAGHPGFATICVLVAGATLGFLWFNLPPARVFMGDVGAPVLGLTAGALMLYANKNQLFPIWIGMLVFSPFIVDASVTLLRRLAHGEAVWRAHRSHYYQRLVQLGWGHRKTVSWEYALMSLMLIAALVAHAGSDATQWMIIVGSALLYMGLAWMVHHLEARGAGADA